jgi:acetyltransferase-like isoleucine patch superfamily enzyme
MLWDFGRTLTSEHRARLVAAGADPDAIDAIDLREASGPLPAWWAENGNALYATADLAVPQDVIERMTGFPFSDALIALANDAQNVVSLLVGGPGATVFLGPETELTAGEIYCGDGSAVILNGHTTATRCAMLDARNGGAIVAAADQLWAGNVYIATDDMHRLEDPDTGARINPFGATIRIGHHVWIGRDAIITGHVDIGEGSVVGARSYVRGMKVPPHTSVAGTPARIIRENVTWSSADVP